MIPYRFVVCFRYLPPLKALNAHGLSSPTLSVYTHWTRIPSHCTRNNASALSSKHFNFYAQNITRHSELALFSLTRQCLLGTFLHCCHRQFVETALFWFSLFGIFRLILLTHCCRVLSVQCKHAYIVKILRNNALSRIRFAFRNLKITGIWMLDFLFSRNE